MRAVGGGDGETVGDVAGAGEALGLGGIVGPAAFIGAWAVGSAALEGYSAIDDAISRLAAQGAATQALMTGGFLTFTVGMLAMSAALRRTVAGPAWVACAVAALATFGVACTPLEYSEGVDDLHGVLAGIGYVAIAATPLLAARPLRRAGREALALGAVVAGTAAAVCLALTPMPDTNGLFQRAGLTSADLWLMTCGLAIVQGRVGVVAGAGAVGEVPA